MSGQVKVTWRTLRKIAHSLMVYARVLEVYINFVLMYMTDHIFTVLTIKDMINEDGDPTMPYKLATGTKPSVSHLRVLFCPCVVQKATAEFGTKALIIRHQAQKSVSWYLRCYYTESKRIPCVLTQYKENNIFI